MIYIDPPYNTGNDFIYPDNYTESLQTYLEYTGQVDAQGKKFSTNTEVDGRFHSKWLNMMYPRLYLARNLLREDGVIFISIDDKEVDNLKRVCHDVFGEENFLACITVISNWKGRSDDKYFATAHNYMLAYSKGGFQMKGNQKQDRGSRVFKLAESNFKAWDANIPTGDVAALKQQLELHIDHIRDGRTPDDILYEILLKSGFQLATPVEKLTMEGKTVFSASGRALFICLERNLTLELIRAMAEQKPERVVCLDEGFAGNDQLKANAVQIFKNKGVTSFKTV